MKTQNPPKKKKTKIENKPKDTKNDIKNKPEEKTSTEKENLNNTEYLINATQLDLSQLSCRTTDLLNETLTLNLETPKAKNK